MPDSINRDALEALGTDRLVDLLIEQANRDHAFADKLATLTATDAERARSVKGKLSGLKRIRRFHDWRTVPTLAQKLEDILAGIDSLALPVREKLVLLFKFYEADASVMNHCDDSSGRIGDVYRHDAGQLFINLGAACEDKDWLADRVLAALRDNDYGVRDHLVPASCEVFSEAQLRAMIGRCLAAQADDDSKDNLSFIARLLAAGIPDGALHEKLLTEEWSQVAHHAGFWNQIAEVYLDAGDAKTAMERLSRIPKNSHAHSQSRTKDLQLRAHRMLGNTKEVVSILRESFLSHPTQTSLAPLLEAAPALRKKQAALFDELASVYRFEPTLHLTYLAFAAEHQPAEAETYMLTRADQLNGLNDSLLTKIAVTFKEQEQPLCASLLRRSIADEILERGRSKYYKYAVRQLKACELLASAIEDWQSFPDHNAYCAQLKERHARKSALWSKWTPGE